MKSGGILRLVFKKEGFKTLAGKLTLAESYLYKWCKPDNGKDGGGLNPLERVWQIIAATGDLRPLHWLCEQCGGHFVRNPTLKVWRAVTLLKATAEVIGHIGKFQTHLAQAEREGHISAAAAEQLRADWEELKAVLESFVVACERGAFRWGA
jgi:hypothetical protein